LLQLGEEDMADTWVINMTHYLDDEGRVCEMPGPARALLDYMGSIVVLATTEWDVNSGAVIRCRRKPKRRPCVGVIEYLIDPTDNAIVWSCSECGDNGIISSWEGTIWDCSSYSGLSS
jgi:hypothetical protein